MSKLRSFVQRKPVRIAIAVAIALGAFAALAMYLAQSTMEKQLTPESVRQMAMEQLGRPVTVAAVRFSPLYGVVMENVTVHDSPVRDSSAAVILHAASIQIRPSWLRIITGKIQISRVVIVGGELIAARSGPGRDADEWNLYRLARDLGAKSSAGPSPIINANGLCVTARAAGEPYDGLRVEFERLDLMPSEEKIEFRIARVNDAVFPMEGDVNGRTREGSLRFEDLPVAPFARFTKKLHFESLGGELQCRWEDRDSGVLTLKGKLEGRRLFASIAGKGGIRMDRFQLREFEAEADVRRWHLRVRDLKVAHGGREYTLRLGAAIEGKGQKPTKGRIEWEGPVETLLAILPQELVQAVARLEPSGPSAGYCLLTTGAKATIETPEIGLSARGMNITIPRTPDFAAIPYAGPVRDIQGLITIAGTSMTFDTVSMNIRESPLTIAGHLDRGESAAAYEFTIRSPGFDAGALAGFLPKGITLDGRVGLDLAATPAAVTGAVSFLGTRAGFDTWGSFDLRGGAVDLKKGGTFGLREVSIASGEGRVVIDGLLDPRGKDPHMDLAIRLAGADLKQAGALAAAAGAAPPDVRLLDGALDGRLTMRGSLRSPSADGEISIRGGRALYAGQEISNAKGTVQIDSSSPTAAEFEASVGGGTLKLSGAGTMKRSKWTIALAHVNAAVLSAGMNGAASGLKASGPVSGDIVIVKEAVIRSIEGRVQLEGTDIALSDTLSLVSARGAVRLRPDAIVVEDLKSQTRSEGEEPVIGDAFVSGTVPLVDTARFDLTVRLGRARLGDLALFFPDGFSARGLAENLELSIRGPRKNPLASGAMRLTAATVIVPFLERAVADITGSVRFSPDSFATQSLAFRTGRSQLRISGSVENLEKPVMENLRVYSDEAHIEDLLALLPASRRPLPKGVVVGGQIAIDSLSIDGPLEDAVWVGAIRITSGSGELPGLERGLTAAAGSIIFDRQTLRAPSLTGRLGASVAHIEGKMDLAPPYALDMRVAVQAADIEEMMKALPGIVALKDMDLNGRGNVSARVIYSAAGLKIDGTLLDGRTSAMGMPFEDVNGRFEYDGARRVLTLSEMKAQWASGEASDGLLTVTLGERATEFATAGKLVDASLQEMVRLGGFKGSGYQGRVSGNFSMRGELGRNESIRGIGHVEIEKGRFPELAALDAVSRVLRADFFSSGTYERVKADFTIDHGYIRTTDTGPLKFLGANYTLEARGYTTFDGDCAYQYRCGVEAGFAGRLITALPIGSLFSLSGKDGVIRSSGTIRGKLSKPEVKPDLGVLNIFR